MVDKGLNIKVLLIDDSEIDLFLYRRLFLKHYDENQIFSCVSPLDAASFVQSFVPNEPITTVLDINMPVVSGFDMLDIFNALPEKVLKMYKIYVVTSSTNRNDHARIAENSFVKELIVKPLTAVKAKSFFE